MSLPAEFSDGVSHVSVLQKISVLKRDRRRHLDRRALISRCCGYGHEDHEENNSKHDGISQTTIETSAPSLAPARVAGVLGERKKLGRLAQSKHKTVGKYRCTRLL